MGDTWRSQIFQGISSFDVGAKILLVSQKCDTFLMRKVGLFWANKAEELEM